MSKWSKASGESIGCPPTWRPETGGKKAPHSAALGELSAGGGGVLARIPASGGSGLGRGRYKQAEEMGREKHAGQRAGGQGVCEWGQGAWERGG